MPARNVRQFNVPTLDRPGVLGSITDLLARSGINLLGITVEGGGGTAFIRLVAEQEGKVKSTLEKEGFSVFETSAFVVDVANRPGELARLAKALGEEGVNIQSIYGASEGQSAAKLVFSVDNAEKARKVFDGALAKSN